MTYNPRTEEAYQLLHNGILALARAEQQGIRVDMSYVEKKKTNLTRRLDKLEESLKQTNFFKHWQHSVKGTININSNLQLANYLYKIKGLEIEKETVSGQGATDDEALRQMNIPELNDLLEIRKLRKLRDYLDLFAREQVDGYLHPFFNLNLVSTYRSSSDHPNFQNIPKRDEESMQTCRRALYPRPEHLLLEVDFSGLEVRIAACYHKDSTMLKYINNPASDMHADMARQLFCIDKFDKKIPEHYVLRQAAKNGFVFPEFYGDYYKNCAIGMACVWGKLPQQGRWTAEQGIPLAGSTLGAHLISKGIKSLDAFSEHVKKIEADFWGRRFVEYAKWKDMWWRLYQKYGYIDLLTGFRCSGIMDRKQVINYPVQGAAFHCLLWSLIRLDQIIIEDKLDARIIGQIHDSILIDVHPDELDYIVEQAHQITCFELPEEWKWIIIPLDVDFEAGPVDGSWAEKEKYTIQK
jgi:DNA polymerase-1